MTILGDVPSKKNSKQLVPVRGRIIPIVSERYKTWYKSAKPQVPQVKESTPTGVILTFYPSTKRKADLTNKAESIMDLLVDCGVIEDDNFFVVPDIRLRFGGVDRENPRCEIEFSLA